tara:strand:+ start:1107 stop:2267 length:1161 start_codon:yes stop_codon:yes gene_type:complete
MKIKNTLYSFNYLLLLLFVIISIVIFFLNIQIINSFRHETRIQVKSLASEYSSAITSSNDEEIRFILDIMLPSLKFPMIIKNSNGVIYSKINIDAPYDEGTPEYIEYMANLESKMDRYYEPLSIYVDSLKVHEIHYGDPKIINRLIWLPYLEIVFFIFFTLIAFSGFQLIRKDEKNLIYAGMARETAHQLGTPISSLMGWLKLLEEGENKDKIIKNINDDLDRLSIISDRFSKIGSIPQMSDVNMHDLLFNVCEYIKTRAPKSIKFIIEDKINKNVLGDHILLDWAFQNIIKNSVDAISNNRNGEILITVDIYLGNYLYIDIQDNGKGISRKNRKNIFKPGFSSKKRGWGLGLSLTKRIVEEIHLGKVWLLQSHNNKTIMRTILPL